MCASMVNIQSPTAQNRRWKERKKKQQLKNTIKHNGLPHWVAIINYSLHWPCFTIVHQTVHHTTTVNCPAWNKSSKKFDNRPHRSRTWMVQCPFESKSQTACRSVQLFFAQLTAESHYTLKQATPFSPQNFPFLRGISALSNTWFLRPTWVLNPNGNSIGSAVIAQLTAECPHALQWAAPPPLSKLLLPMCGSGPHLVHGMVSWQSLGPQKSSTEMACQSVKPFFHGSLTWQTDTPTDRPHYSVCNDRLHLSM